MATKKGAAKKGSAKQNGKAEEVQNPQEITTNRSVSINLQNPSRTVTLPAGIKLTLNDAGTGYHGEEPGLENIPLLTDITEEQESAFDYEAQGE